MLSDAMLPHPPTPLFDVGGTSQNLYNERVALNIKATIDLTREQALNVARLMGKLAMKTREGAAKEAYAMLKAKMEEKIMKKEKRDNKKNLDNVSPHTREKNLKAKAKEDECKWKEDDQKRELGLLKL